MKRLKNNTLTIGKLAATAGVNIETVRYYERKGLIKQPTKGIGFRQYPIDDAIKIKFIKKTQDLGFTLKEAKELLELKINKKAKCSSVKKKTDLKIDEIETKIADLKKIKRTLEEFSSLCHKENVPVGDCPILHCFEQDL